jgi:cephalosporin-C deacetylase-like acetyl esterase
MCRPATPLALLLTTTVITAAEPPSGNAYLDFVRGQAAALRAMDTPPATPAAWELRRAVLRRQLVEAWGGFPAEPCPLDPQSHGVLKRDGYRVEKVTFQTRPGVRMTANAYVPDRPGKLPAILHVHGHWKGAKQDPVVQARCIGSAKLGFFALAVDAFGAGERGVGTALGEYHGEMTAATLLPVGLPLSGLQVYENMRAVDYLLTRPEVDGDRIGVTGASGGGNQTMYAGAMDDRLKAVVPVCSVGNYQAYLGAACCLCEVVPGALRFTEEWGPLAMVAPRALLVVSATKDARQFSPGEAKRSLALAEPVFRLLGKPENVRHAIFESGHDYSRPMREAMYGWMTKHLKGEGDGGPIPEPEIKTETPEALRCYPGNSRPADWLTLPKFAAAEGRKLLAARPEQRTAAEWEATAKGLRAALVEKVLGGLPAPGGADISKVEFATAAGEGDKHGFYTEANLRLSAVVDRGPKRQGERLAVVLGFDGGPSNAPLVRGLHDHGFAVARLALRATGEHGWPSDRVGRAPDHNTAEWGLWLGRPLLGQWVQDVRRLIDTLGRKDVVLVGDGPAGLVALAAAATDDRVTAVAAVGTLASFVSDEPFVGQRLGVIPPGVLRHVGDVAYVAALAAPKRVVIAGGVSGGGKPLAADALLAAYRPAADVWKLLGAEGRLVVTDKTDPATVLDALK